MQRREQPIHVNDLMWYPITRMAPIPNGRR